MTLVEHTEERAAAPVGSLDAGGEATGRRDHVVWLILLGFAATTCLAGLGSGPAMGDHESIVALTARQTVESGNWLIPYLGEIPRIRKTPLGYWATAVTSYLLDRPGDPPVSAMSARFPSAMSGVLNALLVAWLGTMLFGRRAGLVAGFIAAGCVGLIWYSRNAMVDMSLTMFTTLSYACFWRGAMGERPCRKWLAVFYVAFGLAMMAKGPLPLAIVGLPLAVFWLITLPWLEAAERWPHDGQHSLATLLKARSGIALQGLLLQLKRVFSLWFVPGLVVFIVVAGAWWTYALLHVHNAARLWEVEFVDRFSGELSRSRPSFFYYVPMVLAMTVPYLFSLPEAVAAVFLSRYRRWRRELSYCFTWAVVGTLFLSLAAYKRPHYILSVLPAYCLLLSVVIDRLFFASMDVKRRVVQVACRVVAPGLLIGVVVGGWVLHREFPSMVRPFALVSVWLLVACAVAAAMFARGRRTISFAWLNVGTLVAVTITWPAVGACLEMNGQGMALAQEMERHGVHKQDLIYWVAGRPDASIEFYSGYRIRRLINELEMLDLRENRRDVNTELYREFARRIRERLSDSRPVYLILDSGKYEMMRRETDIAPRVLFELSGFHELPGEELAVITQPWNVETAASEPATRPASARD